MKMYELPSVEVDVALLGLSALYRHRQAVDELIDNLESWRWVLTDEIKKRRRKP